MTSGVNGINKIVYTEAVLVITGLIPILLLAEKMKREKFNRSDSDKVKEEAIGTWKQEWERFKKKAERTKRSISELTPWARGLYVF